ncbi:GFA family protein [Vannielia litorea]|uniref:Uncharacterized conserved protein n=1 Tax=Vannielia litorea TaxID=1217970 RepID=A0A1N6G9T9_9RHOB|nr:GFA family protein [Vannielia litorea]SIO04192.1 Uncharacterized conserved protein [Vannielia litorea]
METTGRCLCGATRFAFATEAVLWQGLCTCESCRRASGAPVVGWIGVTNGAWRWEGAPPGRYSSRPGVERCFCTRCGAPLTYASADHPGETHFLAAQLDDPMGFVPDHTDHSDEALPWLAAHHLPQETP